MKKLLLLLFPLMLSFNSYGETLVCSKLDGYGEIDTAQYVRYGDEFLLAGSSSWSQMPIYYEDSESLVLTNNFDGEMWLLFFDKKTKEFSEHLIGVKLDVRWTGKCEVIN